MATETKVISDSNFYHFKTMADFEAHKDEILNNSTIYIDEDVSSGNLGGNISQKVLWENPDPTAEFPEQTITVKDMSEFDYIQFYFKTNINSSQGGLFYQSPKGIGCYCNWSYNGADHGRECNIVSNTEIQFSRGQVGNIYDDNLCIPYKITGIKINGSSNIGSNLELLWENPNPTEPFQAQNINLSSSDYDYLEVYYYEVFDVLYINYTKVQKGYDFSLNQIYNIQGAGFYSSRLIKYINETTLQVNVAYDNSYRANANNCVPYKIYGVKSDSSSQSNENIYSTEETIIGKWIDGRPIYRKVFTGTFGSVGNYIMGYIQGIKTLVNSYGYYVQGQYLTPINTTFNSDLSSVIQVDNTNGQIIVAIKNSLVSKEYTYTFEYTKTTD